MKLFLLLSLFLFGCASKSVDPEKVEMAKIIQQYQQRDKQAEKIHKLDASQIKNLEDVKGILGLLNITFSEGANPDKEQLKKFDKINHLFKEEKK